MLPIRCFTCNSLVGHFWNDYETRKCDAREFLDQHNIRRLCCRRMLLTHVPIIDDIVKFSNDNTTLDHANTKFLAFAPDKRCINCD